MIKKVVLVIASNEFQQDEYRDTHEVLSQAGVQVITASDKMGLAVAHDGSTVPVDMLVEDVQPAAYDGIFLIGGRGAKLLDTPIMYKLLNETMAIGKAYGAICISPRILAKALVLRGKKATCWDADHLAQPVFDAGQVIFVHEPVVVDGNVVTANGPRAAHGFGQAMLQVL